MATEIDRLFYTLEMRDKDFVDAVRRSKQGFNEIDDSAGKASVSIGSLERAAKSLGTIMKTLAAGFTLREFVANTVEAQHALAQLQAALKSTGGAAGFTLPELVKMSEEMSKLSTFSDEAVKGGLSRLLTYTGIQGPMFKEAARATLDFATALNIDVSSAAERVGNALQYPTEAINSLTKQGFRFTAEQKRLIAAFEDTGQLAKAQAIILGELDLAYKGSAEAARNTLGGALVALKNAFTDTLEVSKESSGGIISAINSIAEAMPAVSRVFNAFFGGLQLLLNDAVIGWQKLRLAIIESQIEKGPARPTALGFQFLTGAPDPNDRIEKLKAQAAEIRKLLPDLKKWREEQERLILGLNQPGPTPAGRAAGTTPRGLTDAQIAAQKNARLAFEAATAGQTTGGVDNFETQVTKLIAAAQKAHIGATEIAKMVNELRTAHAKAMAEEGQKLALSLQGQLAQLTSTTVDDLRAQLAEFDRAIEEQRSKGVPIDPTVVEQLRAAKEAAIALAPETEAIDKALTRIKDTTAEGFNLSGSLDELSTLIERAQAVRDALPVGSTEREKAEERIKALIAQELDVRTKLLAIQRAARTESDKLVASIGVLASNIQLAANIALGLASAFAGANAEITKMVGGIANTAGGVADLIKLAQTKNKDINPTGTLGGLLGNAGGLLQAAGAAGQIIGGAVSLASSLFGKSPEEQRRAELTKQNTEAVRKLTERVGELGLVNVTGTQLGQLAQFFQNPALAQAGALPGLFADKVNRLIGTALTAAGLSAAEFKDIMRSFGGTIDDAAKITVADVEWLKKAIAESQLTEFAHDFTGQMSQFNAEVKIFDLQTPIAQFDAFRRAVSRIGEGGGALQTMLAKFDLTTAEGIAKAEAALQELFRRMQAGAITAEQLGGLTPEQFEQLIEQAIGIVRAQAGSGAVPGTGGFNVSREITETTGSRMAALLSTGNVFAEQTAKATQAIAMLLGGGIFPAIQPPAAPIGSGAGAGGIVFEPGSINISVTGTTDHTNAHAIGTAVGESFIDTVDKQLGARVRWKRRSQGLNS